MTERGARHAIGAIGIALALAILGAPVAARGACERDAGGIGGTGRTAPKPPPVPTQDEDRGGVGGTGRSERDQGGIGGTGISKRDRGGVGGTGVVGVITGFGSVCVNGLEIEYDEATPVEADGQPASVAALSVGQVVAVHAAPRDGALWADHIGVRSTAIGPVERFDAGRGELEVLGQRVYLDSHTHLADARGAEIRRDALEPGAFVTIHGLRRGDGAVVATRIEQTPPREHVSVSGPVERIGERLAIGGLTVVPPPGGAPETLDRPVTAVGRFDVAARTLVAERVEPAVRFAASIERLSVEGYVLGHERGGFRTDLVDVDTSGLGKAAPPPGADARVVVSGPLEADGRLRAERVDVVEPDRPSGGESGQRGDRARDDDDDDEDRGLAGATDRDDHGERERPEKPENPEKPEQVEKPENAERPEAPERPEVDEHEAPEGPEAPERPEIDEVEVPERPEAPERPEIDEHEVPERPEIDEHEVPERPEIDDD